MSATNELKFYGRSVTAQAHEPDDAALERCRVMTREGGRDRYVVCFRNLPKLGEALCDVPTLVIQFQRGDPREVGTNGVSDVALLSILIDRMEHGPTSCATALQGLNDSMAALKAIADERFKT